MTVTVDDDSSIDSRGIEVDRECRQITVRNEIYLIVTVTPYSVGLETISSRGDG